MQADQTPYAFNKSEKDRILTEQLLKLTLYHRNHCDPYRAMLEAIGFEPEAVEHYSDLPFLPAGLFKQMTLSSAGQTEDLLTTTSSGTSGQETSKILLDGETRALQREALAKIGVDFLGPKRLPMLIIDCPSTIRNTDFYSARSSGILGFSLFGYHRTFALTDEMELNEGAVREFVERFGNEPFFLFGFTSIIWEYFCMELKKRGWCPDLSKGILIHGGGWKKLENLHITKEQFRNELSHRCNLTRVHDYYGMAEQTGSIFMECEYGNLHASDYSGLLCRRPKDFSLCQTGEPGILQVLSVLPRSFPGHSILTEDEGVILGEDDCPCGRCGTYFRVFGRLKYAEIRGCSDTFGRER